MKEKKLELGQWVEVRFIGQVDTNGPNELGQYAIARKLTSDEVSNISKQHWHYLPASLCTPCEAPQPEFRLGDTVRYEDKETGLKIEGPIRYGYSYPRKILNSGKLIFDNPNDTVGFAVPIEKCTLVRRVDETKKEKEE